MLQISAMQETAHAELFKHAELDSLPSLDVGYQDFNTLGIQITTCSGQTSKLYSFKIEECFSTQNRAFIEQLDNMIQECLTISLDDSDQFCQAVHRVTLAGGYAHILCSTTQAMEQIQTIRDGVKVTNEFARYNLHRHFQYVLVCRLNELIQESLAAVRFEDPGGEFPAYTSDAFASAVILRYEMGYFKRSLRNGELSSVGHMPNSFKPIMIAWFSAIDHELTQHLRFGCGQYPNWQDSIIGSKKLSRRKAQKLSLILTLEQTKHTVGEPPPAPAVYTPSGSGNNYLLPSPGTPTMLAVPGLSFYDNPGEVEQIPSHVSGPLSNAFDTWEETSVSWISDLFPDLRHYDTFMIRSDEGIDLIN